MRKIIALLMILTLPCLALAASKTKPKTQTDTKKKIAEYNAIAKEKSKQSKTLLSQLSRLKQDASSSQEKINSLEQENTRLASSVSDLNKKIANVQASMSIILTTLKGRLADMYKYSPDEQSLSMILSANNFHDAVNTAYMLRRFTMQDVMMLHELVKKEHELIAAREQLEANKSKIAQQTDELRRQRTEYDNAVKKTDNLLRNVQSEQRQAEAAARELQNAQRAVGSKINTLMKQKNKTQAKKAAASPRTTVGGAKATVPVKTASNTSSGSVRSLSWPVNGTVSMQYGSRVHPTFKTKIFNSGIDIKAASGTPVKAAGPGEVLYQGWLRGFGQVVIIDHGGDISTVYAHLGGTSVREGATVKTGTVIGKVGNTGTDSEYGLHFEVRRNGSAVNPMNFLR